MTESNINMRYINMCSLIHYLDESVEKLKNILTNKISCVTKLKFALLRVLLLYSVISHIRYICQLIQRPPHFFRKSWNMIGLQLIFHKK